MVSGEVTSSRIKEFEGDTVTPAPTSFHGIAEQMISSEPNYSPFNRDLYKLSLDTVESLLERAISLAVQATRQDESGRISAMAAKHQIRVDEHPDDLWSRGGRDACAFLADKLMEPIPADQITARMADLLASDTEQKGKP